MKRSFLPAACIALCVVMGAITYRTHVRNNVLTDENRAITELRVENSTLRDTVAETKAENALLKSRTEGLELELLTMRKDAGALSELLKRDQSRGSLLYRPYLGDIPDWLWWMINVYKASKPERN